MKKTFDALVARGVNTDLAKIISDHNITIAKLKVMSIDNIISLGFSKKQAEEISSESRPPIPSPIVIKVLYDSKWACCICRDKSRGVVIHHIEEWNISRNHDEKNLVVLCSEHHDLAHSKKVLTLNLDKERLLESKRIWIEQVKMDDTKLIQNLYNDNAGSRWNYFNHNRIFEIYLNNKLSNHDYQMTSMMKKLGLIDNIGIFPINDSDKAQLYHFGNGLYLYYYVKELFDDVMKKISLIDLTSNFSKMAINSLTKVADYIALQGAFYFKNLTKLNEGRGQRRLCYYKKGDVKIEFEFDAYESTSISAWGTHLMGHKVITIVGQVTSITYGSNILTLTISCLALGCYFKDHPSRKDIASFSILDDEDDEK